MSYPVSSTVSCSIACGLAREAELKRYRVGGGMVMKIGLMK